MPNLDHPVADPEASVPSRGEVDDGCRIDWRQLSHELRTPLNAILGNIELLLDGSAGPLSAQARTCLGEVQVAGHHLLRQVRLLLAWSELCIGRPKLTHNPLDLVALVREALAIECAGAVRIKPDDARLTIAADPFWLRMLVAEIAALGSAPGAAPTVTLEQCAGRATLDFAWPGFCASRTAPLQIALVEAIALRQGAVVAWKSDGLALHWPVKTLHSAQAGRGAPGSDPAGCRSAGPPAESERP